MHELMDELKQLRLHGMAQAWADLIEQGGAGGRGPGGSLDAARWLVEHLVHAEVRIHGGVQTRKRWFC